MPDNAPPDLAFEAGTARTYDALSVNHLHIVSSDLSDRAHLELFASAVLRDPGPVADVGCGPGGVTGLLYEMGLDVFGVDLSPAMVALARTTHPHLRFDIGSMLALDIAGGSLAGLLSCYSFIHVPWELRPLVFAEFRRVLRPGGVLMLVYQVGSDFKHRSSHDGLELDATWYRQQPDELVGLLDAAGFDVHHEEVRPPREGELTPQGHLLATARRPEEDDRGELADQ
ncbi:class I SAM-dependent DNA methyltransferase [Dactylosporangium sp. CS-047395]|uniref:class I SAM-dependent DNA methyltransferase n=1 Tax=Dactylosporangium sp. CS-047395 TaxID=3239936 RepID=UPI003D8AF366